MLNRLHITMLVILAAAIWGAGLYVLGIPLTWDHVKPFSLTVFVLAAIMILFERWLWKWPIFRGWLVKSPNIQGTWHVALRSADVDPKREKRMQPIECVMVFRQTFSTLSMRLHSDESSSTLVAYKIVQQNDGVFEVMGVYQNEPQIHLRGDRSEIHYGALKLAINGEPVVSLQGHYWTDRETKGSLKLTNRKKQLVASFDEGARLYGL
jgi:hypothetical protein